MRPGTKHYDPLAAARAQELDAILEHIAEFAGPRPTKVAVMFESLLLSYAALASRHGSRTVLLGQEAYDRAKETGLLAWCREQYPNLTFEPPRKGVRGCHASMVIVDELANWKPDEIRSHGG